MSENIITTRLRQLRDRIGVNQDVVAEACDISRVALTRYENGQRVPRAQIAARLADYYSVTVDYLLGRDDAPTQPQEKAPADDPLTEQIMAKVKNMNEEELRQLLRIMDALKT